MAHKFYVTIEGTTQGAFKGESIGKMHQGKLEGEAYHHEIRVPIDAHSGMTTGGIEHQPMTFRHICGSSSPQLFQAMNTQEALRTVLFEFVRASDRTGTEGVFYRVRLTDARVTGIHYITDSLAGSVNTISLLPMEHISLAYRTIEIEFVPGKIVATAEWAG